MLICLLFVKVVTMKWQSCIHCNADYKTPNLKSLLSGSLQQNLMSFGFNQGCLHLCLPHMCSASLQGLLEVMAKPGTSLHDNYLCLFFNVLCSLPNYSRERKYIKHAIKRKLEAVFTQAKCGELMMEIGEACPSPETLRTASEPLSQDKSGGTTHVFFLLAFGRNLPCLDLSLESARL